MFLDIFLKKVRNVWIKPAKGGKSCKELQGNYCARQA
jgi:hypothetical protein